MMAIERNGLGGPSQHLAAASRASGARAPSPLFDTWLQDNLQRRYEAALEEPLPEELVRLLDTRPEGGRQEN